MEGKKWVLAVSLICIVAVIPLKLHNMELALKLYAFMGEWNYILPAILQGGNWSSGTKQERSFAVSPDMSKCYPSFEDTYQIWVNCCPPSDNSQSGATFVNFTLPKFSSLRVRKAAHEVDQDYIAKYAKGIKIMKSLPYSDPRSFARQADLACMFATGSYKEKHSGIQLSVRASWLFFPWYRIYLYYFECILGKVIQDDSFALPFWAWDHPDGMRIPTMYQNEPFFDKNRDPRHLNTTIILDYDGSESDLDTEQQIRKNLEIMHRTMITNGKTTEQFMGGRYTTKSCKYGHCDKAGSLEITPHNNIHVWSGNPANPYGEDMGNFYSSGRDTMFYGLHANVDRMWDVWTNKLGNQNFDDEEWLNSAFYLYDENKQLVKIKVSDVLDSEKLGYTYETRELPWAYGYGD